MNVRRMYANTSALLLAVALATPVPAQDPSAEAPVRAFSGDLSSLASPFSAPVVALLSSFPQAEPARRRGRGALIGGGIGLLAGGVLGGLSVQSDDDGGEFGSSLGEGAATGAAVVLGGLFGATVGAVLGATVLAPSASAAGTSSSKVVWRPTVVRGPATGAWRPGVLLKY